jgi:hypothetical protein
MLENDGSGFGPLVMVRYQYPALWQYESEALEPVRAMPKVVNDGLGHVASQPQPTVMVQPEPEHLPTQSECFVPTTPGPTPLAPQYVRH